MSQTEVQADMATPVGGVTGTSSGGGGGGGNSGGGNATGIQAIVDLAPGHWYEISELKHEYGRSLPNQNLLLRGCGAEQRRYSEGQAAVMNDWNSGAYDTLRNRLAVWGGGHGGYGGDGMYTFDVMGTQQWARLTEPTLNPVCTVATGLYQDGNPCSTHNYGLAGYDTNCHSFIPLSDGSTYSHGLSSPAVNLFSFATHQWRQGAPRPGFGDGSNFNGESSAYDPNRHVFWVVPSLIADNTFVQYDPGANNGNGLWTQYSSNNTGVVYDHVSAIDPDHDLMVTIDGTGNHQALYDDLKTPNVTRRVALTTGDKALESVEEPGFESDPAIRLEGWHERLHAGSGHLGLEHSSSCR